MTSIAVEGHSVANIESQIKHNKTNQKANDRYRRVTSKLKTPVRQTREPITLGDKERAGSISVFHENQAANRKSAIAKQVASL
jgi:small subunit ribosomal protein S20